MIEHITTSAIKGLLRASITAATALTYVFLFLLLLGVLSAVVIGAVLLWQGIA